MCKDSARVCCTGCRRDAQRFVAQLQPLKATFDDGTGRCLQRRSSNRRAILKQQAWLGSSKPMSSIAGGITRPFKCYARPRVAGGVADELPALGTG